MGSWVWSLLVVYTFRMELWVNFAVVISVQALVFFALAERKCEVAITHTAVLRLLLLGLVFGYPFDLLFGNYLGIYQYHLGFGALFLLVNGILSFGLMFATVFLLSRETFSRFYLWTIAIAMVYETTNYFFPVWQWTFGSGFLYQELIVVGAAYCGLSLLKAITIQIVLRTQFLFLNFKNESKI